jgi:hypothetical protein
VAATLVPVIVTAVAPGSTLAVATATPMALGDSILFIKFQDYPTIASIVGVLLVEDAVASASTLITLGAVPAVLLMIRFRREGSRLLTLRVLGLQLWLKRLRQVVHEEPPLLSLSASVGDLEEPDDGSQLIIHGQLLLHLDVGDAHEEHGDNLLIGDLGNLVPHLAEALDVLAKRFALVLTHRLEIILGGGALVRRHEVGDELTAQVLPRSHGFVRKIHEPSPRSVFEVHGKPISHHTLVSTCSLNGDDVELEKLDGVGGSIITRADVRPELVGPDHVVLLASESKAPGVVDRIPGDLDILASFADVIDGAVMIFAAALKGDTCVFQSALDDLAARLPARRRCGVGNHLLGLSGLPISGTRGAVPRRRIWLSRALGSSQGRVFIGDGDEFGDLSTPPLTPVRSELIAQQLLRHGESLHRGQLTPRTSARSSGGGEGERRLRMPGWEVGGLQIFLLFLLGQDVLAMKDGLGLSPNGVAEVETLEPCVGVGHVEADLEKNTPQPPT